jgi:tripartite-type tricarboxylate transporter receptor subunit TctC
MNAVFSLALACSMWVATATAFAVEPYPQRPIRLIVPTVAGGTADTLARIMADRLRGGLGQPVVVDNRPGANGIVASSLAAKAAPDGYTILITYMSHVINPALYKDLPYDTVRDFAPVTVVATQSLVLFVAGSSPMHSVKDLIAQAAAKPGELNYAVSGVGSLGHLGAELFALLSGIKLTLVPYKGVPQSQAALLSGEAHILFSPLIASSALAKAGRLRPLGVSTKARLTNLPDVPTIAEAGVPGYEVTGWNSIVAPAKTPRQIINRLNVEFGKVLRAPDVVAILDASGNGPAASSPEELGTLIKVEIQKWARVIKAGGIKLN